MSDTSAELGLYNDDEDEDNDSIPSPEVSSGTPQGKSHYQKDYHQGEPQPLNGSDVGAIPSTTGLRRHDSMDSAYGSGRVSYSTAFRQRRQQYTDDINQDFESKPSLGSLKKSFSMMELETPQRSSNMTYTQSSMNYQPQKVVLRAKSGSNVGRLHRAQKSQSLYASNDHINGVSNLNSPNSNPWEKKKNQNLRRRSGGYENFASFVIHDDRRNQRPISADSPNQNEALRSNASSRNRTRRTLPKVPTVEGDLEERKKRLSIGTLKMIKSDSMDNETVGEGKFTKGQSSDSSISGNTSREVTPHSKRREVSLQNVADEHCSFTQSLDDSMLGNGGFTVHKSQLSSNYYHDNNSSDSDTPQRHYPKATKYTPKESQGEVPSKEALQKIICDLRHAAKHSSSSRTASHSSVSSLSPEKEPEGGHGDYTGEEPELNQAQVDSGLGECDTSKGYTTFSPDFNKKNEIKVTHPSLLKILKSCELITVQLVKDFHDEDDEFGMELFESTFSDSGNLRAKEKESTSVFRPPSGRHPVIGRQKSAFMPVTTGPQETGPVISVVAVDIIYDNSAAKTNGQIQEGDIFIEINGKYVGDYSVEQVKAEICKTGNHLDLVLARPKSTNCSLNTTEQLGRNQKEFFQTQKDLEKLKMKYSGLKQDSEKNLDIIAELKLELKEKDAALRRAEKQFKDKEFEMSTLECALRQKDEKIAEWKFEANQSNIEISRLKFDSKQKDERIAQLRRLLIQQSELMQLADYNGEAEDSDDIGEEHVSAV